MTTSERYARKIALLGVIGLVAALAGRVPVRAAAPDVATFYVRKDTFGATVLASRERYAAWWQTRTSGLSLGPWHATERGDACRLAKPIDLQRRDKKGNRRWPIRRELIDGVVNHDLSNHGINERRVIPDRSKDPSDWADREPEADVTAAAHTLRVRTITADRAVDVTAWVGAECGLEVWLNGKRLFADAALGDGLQARADQARVVLPLRAGENQLVLRLMGHRFAGFYFATAERSELHPDSLRRLWQRMADDFPVATRRAQADVPWEDIVAWFRERAEGTLPERLAQRAVAQLHEDSRKLREEFDAVRRMAAAERPERYLNLAAEAAQLRKAASDLDMVDFAALRRAIGDLTQSYPTEFPSADLLLQRAGRLEAQLPAVRDALHRGDPAAIAAVEEIVAFGRETLLANPLLDFDRLLLIKRRPLGDPRRAKGPNRGMGEFFGLPQQSAWQLDRIRQPYGWENEIAVLSPVTHGGALTTLYRPPTPRLISDVDLHYDGDKLLLSMPGNNALWQVFELSTTDFPASRKNPRHARQVTPGDQANVHNFDACYLPVVRGEEDRLVFVSTAPFQGVPCSNGIVVGMNYVMDADGKNLRQLCYDQDHDYCPTVMNDGRLLYLRWDYTDLPHQWPRILFTMNPDGTSQREFYGSNSYWPNAIFFARPVPNHPSKIVGVVTGHHVGRVGELIVFDPAAGRQEADGVVQRIPGYGKKVEPIIMDKLTIDSWPKFAHPFPLSDKYFLVASKPRPNDLWGIYLVDVFDNMVLLKEVEGYALFEPIPLRRRQRPPVIPPRSEPQGREALMYVEGNRSRVAHNTTSW